MDIFIPSFIFIIGLFVGSFLNVVILRWDSGKSIVFGRSVCAHTGAPLPWYDLIPVVSYVVLLGKSRFSKKPLSIQYPIVELLTGILFAGVYLRVFSYGGFDFNVVSSVFFVLYTAIISILIVITVYDFYHKIIPDPLVFSFSAISFLNLVFLYGIELFSTPEGISSLLAAPLLAAPFALLWYVSGGRWIGFGDAKLAWGIGWMLGLLSGFSAIMLAFWIGAAVSIFLLALQKLYKTNFRFLPRGLTIKSEVPFAPFLILGTLLVFFFNLNVFTLFY